MTRDDTGTMYGGMGAAGGDGGDGGGGGGGGGAHFLLCCQVHAAYVRGTHWSGKTLEPQDEGPAPDPDPSP